MINAVLVDFDGVLTTNEVHIGTDGHELVTCNKYDSYALQQMQEQVRVLCVSSERSAIVQMRCKKIGIPAMYGVKDKLAQVRLWASQHEIKLEHMVYIGNDVNDLELLSHVGHPFCPSDAHSTIINFVKAKSLWRVLNKKGGTGCVREFYDRFFYTRS